MHKFLKIYYKFNMLFCILLAFFSLAIFLLYLVEIPAVINIFNQFQEFSTFGLLNTNNSIYVTLIAGFCGFFANQHFYHIYLTLYNFDKFKEISGLSIIIFRSILQLIVNIILLGIFAIIPLVLNLIAMLLLFTYQKRNNKTMEQFFATHDTTVLQDASMQEMSFKIGQLRLLKSEGKISEEEFMFHLNNILENKE